MVTPHWLMRSVLKGNAMSKITPEQIRAAAEDACNKGFPYFKHGESSTEPHDITPDYEAALRIAETLPDCFVHVTCRTDDNLSGLFRFYGKFMATPNFLAEVHLDVDRYTANLYSKHLAHFFHLYMRQEPKEVYVIPTTYNEVVNREG